MTRDNKRGSKPTDEQILSAVGAWGNSAMTYVVKNRLQFDFNVDVPTPWVLRQLKRLEKAGAVERVSTSYAVQICWRARARAGARS